MTTLPRLARHLLVLATIVCGQLPHPASAAENPAPAESFTASLNAGQLAAAGLGDLTPEQRATLDALVLAHQEGRLARAQAAAAAAQAEAEARARREAEAATEERLRGELATQERESRLRAFMGLGRTDDLAFDAQLVGEYRGYEKGTILTLDNGQRWRVTDGSYWSPRREGPIKVRIEPGMLGSFFMKIEAGGRPRVKLVE